MPDSDLRILLPLQQLIDETIRSTPVPIGGLTDDLAAFVADVDAERQAQLAKWGEQHHPDGTSGHNFRREADAARRSCQSAAQRDAVTWFHILREEFWEAMAETDPKALRTELVQCAAVIQAWIADIDGRTDRVTG